MGDAWVAEPRIQGSSQELQLSASELAEAAIKRLVDKTSLMSCLPLVDANMEGRSGAARLPNRQQQLAQEFA